MYQPYVDALTEFATSERWAAELASARDRYFGLRGKVFEDDETFEPRMAAFLEWYLLSRRFDSTRHLPVEEFLYARGASLPEADVARFRALAGARHGLFQVSGFGREDSALRDLWTLERLSVTERRSLIGIGRGDVIEATLIPFDGRLWFGHGFVCHPPEAAGLLVAHVARQRKRARREPVDTFELIGRLAAAELRYQRHRRMNPGRPVAVKTLYAQAA